MTKFRGIIAAVAVVVLIGIVVSRNRTRDITAENSTGEAGAGAAQTQTVEKKRVAAPSPTRATDVYFLSEAGAGSSSRRNASGLNAPAANGNRRMQRGQAITTAEEGMFIQPRWSPDGLELMFSRPGYNGLFAKGSMGGELTQITDREHVGFNAKFNEDGSIETRSSAGEKQTFNPDGTPVDSVSAATDTSIVGPYTKDDTVYYRANPGEAAQPISAGDDRYHGGVVSPDGKYIAYNGLHTGLYIAPLDGSAPPVNVGQGYSASWLPDSSGVVFNYAEDDGHNLIASDLYHASRDGQEISNLTQTPDVVETNPAVGPDGKKIAYEVDGTIYVGEME